MPFKPAFIHSRTWRYVCFVFAFFLFFSDLYTPAGYAHGGLYTILLMMVTLSGDLRLLRRMAALSIALTILAAILTPTGALLNTVMFNRTLSVLEILLFTGLCIAASNYFSAMLRAQKDLETSISIIDEQRDMLNMATSRERKVQELLVKFKYSFQQFADCIPQVIWTATSDGSVDYANEAFLQYTGIHAHEVYPGDGWMRTVHAEDIDNCLFLWGKAIQNGTNYSAEFRIRRHDGDYRWHRVEAHPLRDEKGTIYKWCGSAVDIHSGKEMAEQIRRQGQHLIDTLESITDAFVTVNKEWVFTYVNREAERLLQKSRIALLDQNAWMLFPNAENFKQQYEKSLREHTNIAFAEYYEPLGKWLEIRAYATEEGLAIYFRDVTETRLLQERLSQTQKLESLGQLTGGIAHDFNNLLTVILGNIELMQEALLGSTIAKQDLLEMVESVEIAATRGADLTHRLLAFARRQPLEPSATEMKQLMKEMENLLRRTLPENLTLKFHVQDDLWMAHVDSAELENAVLNLCLNSRDAMPNGGELTIETDNVVFDHDFAEANADVAPGEYVMIAVSDNGSGIPADVLPHVFDPFFTTKGPGSGTGLGLSMVYGFVKQSQGHVKIYSEAGHGTTVRMYLPRANTASKEPRAFKEISASRGTEVILLVEDNELVREHSYNLLVDLGYQVLEAGDGEEALAVLRRHPEVQLLFTDIIMPGGMNGRELADAAREMRPDLKVLFTSGYTENVIVQEGKLISGLHLLSKPYQRRELANKVRQVLESP